MSPSLSCNGIGSRAPVAPRVALRRVTSSEKSVDCESYIALHNNDIADGTQAGTSPRVGLSTPGPRLRRSVDRLVDLDTHAARHRKRSRMRLVACRGCMSEGLTFTDILARHTIAQPLHCHLNY